MDAQSNHESESSLPTSSIEPSESVPTTSAASAAAAGRGGGVEENENAGCTEPPTKRSRCVNKPRTEEATSSTSPTTIATHATNSLVVPGKETAKATPHKQASPTRTAEATSSISVCKTSAAQTSALRKFRKIPIFIVDYHNDVLEFLYRCLATRHLPLENNILVHFDSHPDMVINRSIPASAAFDKEAMLEKLSIESWIMPTCYTGHFNRVVWLKNSWCQQIPVGEYNFKIGHRDDKICVDSTLDYFISEGNYCASSELEDSRNIELQVLDADSVEVPTDFITTADAQGFVLDIDLDFFSTSNPFLEIYKEAECYARLTEIFHFETSQEDCNGTAERRKQQLNELREIFEHLELTNSLDNLHTSSFEIISENIMEKIRLLYEALHKHYCQQEIDWLLIYDSGCTTDSNGLPHHVSTDAELEQYFANLKTFLKRLAVPPVAITMACSAEDDYCPKFQVQMIQERVLQVIREVFGERVHEQPILQYMDDEWDIMQL